MNLFEIGNKNQSYSITNIIKFRLIITKSQQCHISRILEIFCGDAASTAGDAAPALGRCGISTEDLQNSGYVTLLLIKIVVMSVL